MKVLFVAAECSPLVKVGGLADVIGSLPLALKESGIDVSILLPFYETIKLKEKELKLVLEKVPVIFDGKEEKFDLWKTFLPNSEVPVFLIKNDKYFKGGAYIESDDSSGKVKGEAGRFLFLSAAGKEITKIFKIDVLHCHDWHAAMIPFLLKREKINIKNILTIHNLQYQGIYSCEVVNELLDTNFTEEVNCLKEGIANADLITTVSPSYSKEIMTKEYGSNLEEFLKERKQDLTGILNGLDVKRFNPETDPNLKTNYSLDNIAKKKESKEYLQKKYFGETNLNTPILGIISRLAEQKGINLIQEMFSSLMKENVQFVLLGTGNKEYEKFFREKNKEFPQKVFADLTFNMKLARQIYAGADIFLMPSLFEPCGLGQLISMRYGTVPLVRATGGLKDTVKESGTEQTGFVFKDYNSKKLLETTKRALHAYEDKKAWEQIQKNGMSQDFSWRNSSKKYIEIYKKLKEK